MRLLPLAALLACACSPRGTETPSAAAEVELRHPGCFLLHDLRTGKTRAWNAEACREETSPASTFKIPHALIGLETGVIPDAQAVRSWDEDKYSWAPWGREDQTLVTAIRESVVWFFMEVASGVGRERMAGYLDRFEYGNRRIGDELTMFWLDESLRLSAFDQLEFLRRFWTDELPVSSRHVATVDQILEQPVTALRARVSDDAPLAAAWDTKAGMAFKTGSGSHDGGRVTWLVGRVHDGTNSVVFVSRVVDAEPEGPESPAVEAALRALVDLGLL